MKSFEKSGGGIFDVSKEDVYSTVEEFEKFKKSPELNEVWIKNFGDNPTLLFGENGKEVLKKISQSERLVFLARSSAYLTSTPDDVEKYFIDFPADLEAIIVMFENCGGHPDSKTEFDLFSISAKEMLKKDPKLEDKYRSFRQYSDMADRRRIAPSLLLNNFEYKYKDSFKEFGAAADGFWAVLDESSRLQFRGDHFIDPSKIFTPEYEALPAELKEKFLRKCIAELQLYLVFEETFNSSFTAERVEQDRKRTINFQRSFGKAPHNIAHSMIYRTYQPNSVYDQEQDAFSYEMNSTADRGGDIEEYSHHRLLLAVLDKFKYLNTDKKENTDVIVDFWNKNRNPIFGNYVADALSSQDQNRAASQLLEIIKQETGDRAPLASILYRLELGRIGISSDGVKYLERMYDLGEYNDPQYFVNRLTAKGEVGIFNKDSKLIKYFQLGDLTKDFTKMKADVLDFTHELLFSDTPDESEDEKERRLAYLEEFKGQYFNFYNNKFFEETGVRFNNLSFKEQGWFMHFVKQSVDSIKDKAFDFLKIYGETGFRTFLSLEFGEETGKDILLIGEKLPQDQARRVFEKYCEIIDVTSEVEAFIAREFGILVANDKIVVAKIVDSLLKKGRDVILDFANLVKLSEDGIDYKEVEEMLENIKTDILLSLHSFGSLKKEGYDLSLDDISNIDMQTVQAKDIKEEDAEAMRKMYRKNYTNFPELSEKLLSGFDTTLTQDNTNYYILRYDGKIVGFYRLDHESGKPMYFGSFNIDPDYRGASLGEEMMKVQLDKIAENNVVEADCIQFLPISANYIERGFVATKAYDYAGVPVLKIYQNKEANKLLQSKKIPKEKIVSFAKIGEDAEAGSSEVIVSCREAEKVKDLSFDLLSKKEGEFIVTRYFWTEKDGEKVVCAVFEKVSPDFLEKYLSLETSRKGE